MNWLKGVGTQDMKPHILYSVLQCLDLFHLISHNLLMFIYYSFWMLKNSVQVQFQTVIYINIPIIICLIYRFSIDCLYLGTSGQE